MTGRFIVLLLAVLAVACPPAKAGGDLAGSEIRDRLVGQALRWWAEDSAHYGDLLLAPDGRAAITIENPAEADEGRWQLSGDELCTVWRNARNGTEKCYRVRQVAERRFVTSGGNVFEIVEPGA